MSDGGYRVPGRDIDITVIEQEKICQAAETKRTLISEKEQTKREKASRNKEKWADSGFQVMVAVCTISLSLAGFLGSCSYFESKKTKQKPAVDRCVESSEIITSNTSPRYCYGGGRAVTEKLPGDNVLLKCLCSPEPPAAVGDAGHP